MLIEADDRERHGSTGQRQRRQARGTAADFVIAAHDAGIPVGIQVPEVAETGLTFVENALLKARAACQHTGLPAIADDSGLEVDYLGGNPVFTRRATPVKGTPAITSAC